MDFIILLKVSIVGHLSEIFSGLHVPFNQFKISTDHAIRRVQLGFSYIAKRKLSNENVLIFVFLNPYLKELFKIIQQSFSFNS